MFIKYASLASFWARDCIIYCYVHHVMLGFSLGDSYSHIFLLSFSFFLGKLLCAVTHPVERVQRSCSTGAYARLFNHLYDLKLFLWPGFTCSLLQQIKAEDILVAVWKSSTWPAWSFQRWTTLRYLFVSHKPLTCPFLLTVTLSLKKALNL